MSTILGYVANIADTIFDVGGDLITFITASGHEIALIPLALFIVTAAIGAIRRLITGV